MLPDYLSANQGKEISLVALCLPLCKGRSEITLAPERAHTTLVPQIILTMATYTQKMKVIWGETT